MNRIPSRINMVVEQPLYEAIRFLAERDHVSLSQKARDLVRNALEITEDAALDALAAQRRHNKAPSISHQELKKRLNLR